MNTVNENAVKVANLVNNFANLKGAAFVGVTYTDAHEQTTKRSINVGLEYYQAKEKDLNKVINFDLTTLENCPFDMELMAKAKAKLIESLSKKAGETKQSIGQSEAYTNICKGIKVHNETGFVYITGFSNKPSIIKAGEFPIVNSATITMAKKYLTKAANLTTAKYRNLKFENIEIVNAFGDTIELSAKLP